MKILKLYVGGQKAKAEALCDSADQPSLHQAMFDLFATFDDHVSPKQIARYLLELELCYFDKRYVAPNAITVGAKWLEAVKGLTLAESKKIIKETMEFLRPIVREEFLDDEDVYLSKVGLPTPYTEEWFK